MPNREFSTRDDAGKTRYERWDWLTHFLDEWCTLRRATTKSFTDTQLDAAERRLGLRLPPAVREWYLQFGSHRRVWCAQDNLLTPEEFYLENDRLVFLVESQGVVRWGIAADKLAADDPPVLLDMCDLADETHVEGKSFSEFAVALALYDFKFVSEYVAAGSSPIRAPALKTELLNSPALTPWHWPQFPTTISLWNGSVLEAQGRHQENCWITLASKDQQAFDADLQRLATHGISLSPVNE